MEFGTRGGFTNDEGSVKIGNLFYGSKGWLWIEEAERRHRDLLAGGETIPASEAIARARASLR